MSYKSIVLNLDIDGVAAPVIKLAVDLARRFDARLIGLSAADVPPPVVMEGGVAFEGESLMRQRKNIERRLESLRAEFEGLAGAAVDTEWRGAVGNPTRLLIGASRVGDLIVTAPPYGGSPGNAHRSTDIGNVILQAGRPVLVASANEENFRIDKVLVGWKDTREAKRALTDAMPLLQLAQEVRVVTIDNDATDETWNSLDDVVASLSFHGVKAKAEVLPENSDGRTIADVAEAMHADLVISGAYGHSRFREWIFGGATRSLLQNDRLNRIMSN
ncbi:universal stress protein [Mesorhizobium sp. M2C.T.Ca.TU.002.02.1.1]|uniref:universal stress protein n=1 Tax=Mesorhizobium sp. M2C.T.Ca.TU.002.02.1.1 TaxID=2496788 RepID=UPI000FCB1424|nr:universal stress protein [Mesorhizobium sp. M2C.T.Ca.TU.002.02.1.1]RUU53341.1 universal stress protein [Mesorhizobium sp. M2C.T.Ca.TU.002.02.1.1]